MQFWACCWRVVGAKELYKTYDPSDVRILALVIFLHATYADADFFDPLLTETMASVSQNQPCHCIDK